MSNDVVPADLMELRQELAARRTRNLLVPPSVGPIPMSGLDHRTEQLIAEPCDSRNTGAEGYCNT